MEAGRAYVVPLCRDNLVTVNGEPVARGARVELRFGDAVSFVKEEADFAYRVERRAASDDDEAPSPADDEDDDEDFLAFFSSRRGPAPAPAPAAPPSRPPRPFRPRRRRHGLPQARDHRPPLRREPGAVLGLDGGRRRQDQGRDAPGAAPDAHAPRRY